MIVIVILLQWLSNVAMRSSGLKMCIHDLFRGSLAIAKFHNEEDECFHVQDTISLIDQRFLKVT